MKVRYTRDYVDEFGMHFPKGCVAQHTESDCLARIALGVAEETNADAFLRRTPPEQAVSLECVPEAVKGEEQAKPEAGGQTITKKTK